MTEGILSGLHFIKLDLLTDQVELSALLDAFLLRLELQQVLFFKAAHLLLHQLGPLLIVSVKLKVGLLIQNLFLKSLVLLLGLHLAVLFTLLELCMLALLLPLVVEVVVSLLYEFVFDALYPLFLNDLEPLSPLFELLLLKLFPALQSRGL